MKINKTFKKSISLILTLIMILSTFLVAVVPASAAITDANTSGAAPSTIYFKPNSSWTQAGARTAAYVMNSSKAEIAWVDMIDTNNDGILEATVPSPDKASYIIFCRMNGSTTANNWDNKWNQTGDISIPTNGNNLYTFTGNVNTNTFTGTWSKIDVDTPVTPSTTWYINGRFGVKGGSFIDWVNGGTTDFVLTDDNKDGIYTIDTGYTEKELSDNHTEAQWWIKLYDGSKTYGPTGGNTTGDAQLSLKTADSTLPSTATLMQKSSGSWYISGTSTSGNVILCLDTNTNQFYYTIDSDDVSDTPGAYTIEGTTTNGTLSFKADGKTLGTADANDVVTITVTPAGGYALESIQAVDASGNEITITDNKFTMPASNVTVTATFVFDKSAYIATQGDGLWFDAAPDVKDTTATLVKWNNYTGSSHNTRTSYVLYIPKDVDLSAVTLYNGYDKELTINGTTIPANGSAVANLSETTYTTSGATSQTVQVMQGSSSSMYFHTTKKGKDYKLPTKINASDVDPEDKDSVKADGGTCVTIQDGVVSDSLVLAQIKGRGNSSWKASAEIFGKYAFNMKLDKATELFGLPKSKSFCLLANNADESMLRNALTYDLAKNVGLYDSPEFEFVDIYDNGEYLGTYFVCEKVDVADKNKLIKGEAFDDINEDAVTTVDPEAEINEDKNSGKYTYNGTQYDMQYCTVMDDTSNIPSSTEGTYLLEFEIGERYKSEASWFKSPKGQHVVVKSPEFATKEQVQYIAKKFAEMEATVYNSSSSLSQISNYIDVDSFAKMYLIQELSSNLDAAATSYYITVDCSGNTIENGVLTDNAKFVASPVWDYDWAYGQYDSNSAYVRYDKDGKVISTNSVTGWFAKNKSMDDSRSSTIGKRNLQAELASHSAFQPVIKKVWNGTGLGDGNGFYDNVKTYYNTQLNDWYSQITDSMAMNEYRWGFIKGDNASSWGSDDTGDTLSAAVDFLKNWITDRSAWLNTQFASYSNYTQTVTPTLTAYAADGKTELTGEVAEGTAFVLKATTTETYVTYELYNGANKVAENTTGVFTISDATAGTYNYTVKTVTHSGNTKTSDAVAVTVSGATVEKVTVPNVVGMAQDAATTKLENLGLNVVVTEVYSDEAVGTVISSNPEAESEVNKGSTVTITVSKGTEPTTPTTQNVPDVVGMTENDAKSALTTLGFTVKVITQSSETVESGKVISSNPVKDTTVAYGSEVTIVVSTGSIPKETIQNVTIMFKGTNLKSLTPEFYFNGVKQNDFARVSKADGGYIGTYYTGAYGFYWYSVSLDEVTVGEDNVLRFKTTGTSMDATFTYDFAGCKSNSTLCFAVNNMYNGTEVENITDSDAKKNTFRSAVNMISTQNYASDPTLPKVSQAFLAAAGIATNKALTVGDTNADGDINIKDATAAQMMSAGYVQPTLASSVLGDFDLSGDVNIKDATDIQTHIVYN